MIKRFGFIAVLVAILVIGFALRLYHLTGLPLRGDEAFSVQNWARAPLSYSLSQIATIEPHPALVYITFRGWGLAAGTSEFAMRYLPALVNLLGIPAMYRLGAHLGGSRIGLLGALLWAIHPFQIWHAQDARNYALWAGLSLVAMWLGVRALSQRRWQDWVLYALAATLAANLFYLELFVLAAFAVFVAVTCWRDWPVIRGCLMAQSLAVATTALSFLVLQAGLIISGGYGGTTGGGFLASQIVTRFIPALSFGETLPVSYRDFIWPILAAVCLSGLVALSRVRHALALWLGLWLLLPLALLSLASTWLDVFAPRYVLASAPALVLLLTGTIKQLVNDVGWRRAHRGLALVLVGGWLMSTLYSLSNYYWSPDYAKARDWPAVSAYVSLNSAPDDAVIQLSADAAFGYYYSAPADNMALPASPSQPVDEITAVLEAASQRYRGLWIVGQTFPDWPNVGVVENWLRDHMQPVRTTRIADLLVEQYLPWNVAPDEITRDPLATFPAVVQLRGARVFPPEPTGELTVWLYWEPIAPTAVPLKVFVHLYGSTNPATGSPLWSQDDHYPQEGRLSTQDWAPAATYRDVYALPLTDVPPGRYDLHVGLYNPDTGQRVLLADGQDSLRIQSVELN